MKKFVTVETKKTDVANIARREMFDLITNYLKSVMGAENVSRVNWSEISVAVGETKNEEGFVTEICVNIAPVVKDWKGDEEMNRPPYNRLDEAAMFKDMCQAQVEQKIADKKKKLEKLKLELKGLEKLMEDLSEQEE